MNEQYFGVAHFTAWSAPWYRKLKWWLFGKKVVDRSGPYTLTGYYYRGILYLTSYKGGYR